MSLGADSRVDCHSTTVRKSADHMLKQRSFLTRESLARIRAFTSPDQKCSIPWPAASIRTTLILLGGAILLSQFGCQWSDRRGKVEELVVLPGLSICETEEVFLNIKRDSAHPAGLLLFVDDREAVDARLRRGDQFVLSNGRDYAEWYRVLLLEEDRIVLKRREVYDPGDVRAGVRTVERVIAVKPYNHEKPRQP